MDDFSNPNKTHSYDDILEENNPMPTWWVWSFILCCVFAAIYYLHYEIAGGPTLNDELKVAMIEFEKKKEKAASLFPNLTEAEILQKFSDPAMMSLADGALKARCTVCHGDKLEGKIGPALLDSVWNQGTGTGPEIVKVLREGVGAKGMPPWEGILTKDEIFAITAYLVTNKAK